MKLMLFLKLLVPNASGALWIGLIVAAMVFGDRTRVWSRRNGALALLFAPAVFLLHVLTYRYDSTPRAAAWLYTGVFVATATMAVWGFVLARSERVREAWTPNLPPAVLRALVVVLLVLDVVVVLGRAPDDAGIYSNLGGQRWVETGILPYADGKLRGPDAPAYGAAATYGPLLYASHLPFQVLTGAHRNAPDATPGAQGYTWPPQLATKLASLTFFLLGVWALFVIVRTAAGTDTALGVVALWASSPYVLGIGGDTFVITGLGFISHIAPSATMLLALAAARRPALSGGLFAAAAGVLFFPVFLLPAWLGWRTKSGDRSWWKFVAGYAVVGALLVALVLAFTPPLDGDGPVRLFLSSTLEHQEGAAAKQYGASIDSFWGTHPSAAAVWQKPLFGTTSLFKPTFLLFALAACVGAFWVRARSVVQLAAITAALSAAIQLWKTHATGSYVEWYYPFLLIALAAGFRSTGPTPPPERAP